MNDLSKNVKEKSEMDQFLKKIRNRTDQDNKKNSEHCNGLGTHCCLNCDKCWGGKYKSNR